LDRARASPARPAGHRRRGHHRTGQRSRSVHRHDVEPVRALPHDQDRWHRPGLAHQPAHRRKSPRDDRSQQQPRSRGQLHGAATDRSRNHEHEPVTEAKSRVLVVDDEPNLRKVIDALLTQLGHEVVTEADGESALARVKSSPRGTFDAVISDLRMPGMDGMQLLRALLDEDPGRPVVILTAHGSVDTAVEAVKAGAFDFIEKPFDRDQIDKIIGKAFATRRLSGPRSEPAPSTPASDGMVGRSEAMTTVKEMIRTVAASPSTVLITGESGTGKELVARA